MNYAVMSPEQKRDFGFIKLNKVEIASITQNNQRPNSDSEQRRASRSHLKLVRNDTKSANSARIKDSFFNNSCILINIVMCYYISYLIYMYFCKEGGERLSKNSKVIFASVGVLVALIVVVLMIRSPVKKQVTPEPTEQTVTPAPTQKAASKPKEMDDSHNKVTEVIDDASAAVVKEAPNMWAKIVHSWNWFMGFDAKHAIILIGGMVFIFGIIVSGGKGKRSKQ
jgi:hypothetical protein